MNLRIEPRFGAPVRVSIDSEGWVYLNGREPLGRVYKGTYTYSPPIHRGSPVARYHRKVKCWRAEGTKIDFRTRREAIEWLLRERERILQGRAR